jgi:lysophospholipid acyltransferase (LPLAT)-like uncharacterized protein
MKIRNPFLIRSAGWLGTQAIRGLVRTLRVDYKPLGPAVMPPPEEPAPRYIFLLWHEYLIVPTFHFTRPSVTSLISSHADGQLLAAAMRALGMGVVYGSTNRGGVEAVRQIVRDLEKFRHLAITPDGPRGPRRVIQQGAIYLAAKTGMKIAPLGVAYHKAWRLRSWDRFAIPKPGSRAKVVSGEPFEIPKQIRSDTLEQYRLRVQAELERLTVLAEHWAATNRFDASAAAAPAPSSTS